MHSEVYLFYAVVGEASVILLLLFRLSYLSKARAKVVSQRKSSEVKTGKIAEMLAPLSDEFPVDIKKDGTSTSFLGQPIDYIHFDPEEGVTFIEVKSGDSVLSESQRAIKKRVKQGKVHWKEVRLK